MNKKLFFFTHSFPYGIGELLPAGLTPELLAEELQKFYLLSAQEKKELRKNTVERYRNKCNADVPATEMEQSMKSGGFDLLHYEEFMTKKPPGFNTWSVIFIVKSV